MENIPVKLAAQPVPEFNYFVDNQVLTAGQLNILTDYFDRQHRLTRARLFGAGIVCGLELSVATDRASIAVSKGVALTTDGDLIVVPEDVRFTRCRAFTDIRAKYTPWNSISLLELIPNENDLDGNPQPIGSLSNFQQLTVVLYLESYLRPPEDCTDTDCDNLGPKQMNQLRVLLLNNTDIAAQMPNGGQPIQLIPEVAVRRVKMGGNPIVGSNDLGNRFEAAIDASADDFRATLQSAVKNYAAWMKTPGFGNDWTAIFNKIAAIRDLNNGVQHAYAALKDLADALRELRTAVTALQSQCLLPPGSFAKHVALGELANVEAGKAAVLRQAFIESPRLNRGDAALERVRSMMLRIDLMLRGFSALGGNNGIRVTPSRLGGALGERAIPAYFQSDTQVPLHAHWNFEKTTQQNTATIRGYNASNWSNLPATLEPLNFAHDDCPFYRVEGLLGMEKDSALTTLTNIRNRDNLPFRVEGIQIENDITRIPLRPNFKIPALEGVWHLQREQLFDRLQLAKDYADKLKDTAVDSKVADNSDVGEKIRGAKSKALEINNKLEVATQALYVKPQTFVANFEQFKAPYNDAVRMSFDINTDIQQFAQTPTESPLHHFTVFNHLPQLDRLMDIFNRKIDVFKRQFIFDNFQNQHPGLEYQGGVPAGGTLVIVHQNDRVVAEFALPYAVEFDLDPDVDVTPPQNGKPKSPIAVLDINKFKWIDKLNNFKDVGISRVVLPDLDSIKLQTVQIAGLKTQLESTDIFVKNWLPQIGGTKTNPGLTTGGNLGLTDATLGAKVARTALLSGVIKDIEAQENRTPEQEQMLNGLRLELDKETAATIEHIAKNNLEVTVGSDAFLAMNELNNSVKGLSEATRTGLNQTKDLQTKEEITKNTNLNILFTGFNLRR